MENPSTLSFAAFSIFRDNLYTYMDGVFTRKFGEKWRCKVHKRDHQFRETDSLDLTELVNLFYDYSTIFQEILPNFFPKQLIGLIKSYRNRVMHQHALSYREAYRIVDLMCWFLNELNFKDKNLLEMRDRLFPYIHINIPDSASIPIPKEEIKTSKSIDLMAEDSPVPQSSLHVDEISEFVKKSEHLTECELCSDLAFKSEVYRCDQCNKSSCFDCLKTQLTAGDAACKFCSKVIQEVHIREVLS